MNKDFIKNFLKGSISTSVGQFATIIIHFFSIMIMTRYISKEGFGLYFLILAISVLLQKLSSLGLELTLVKFIAAKENDERSTGVFVPVLLLRTVQLLIIGIVFYLLSDLIFSFFSEKINSYAFFIIIIFYLGSYRDLFFHLLQGLKKYNNYVTAQVLSAITKLLLIVFIIQTSTLTVENLIHVEIISYSLTILVQVVFIPFVEFRNFNFNRGNIKEILYFSIPLYLNNVLTVINDRISTFIIAAFLDPASIANFEVAKKIPEAFTRMFKSFIIVYFPNLSTLFSEKKNNEAHKLINQSLSFFSISILFLVSVAFLFQQEIIELIFSEEYFTAAFAFALLMFNFYLRTISNILGYSLVAAGHSSVPVKANSITSIINIGAGLVMIPVIGFIGAVYALLIMNSFSLLINYLFFLKYRIQVEILKFFKPFSPFILLITIYYLIGSQDIFLRLFLLLSYLTLSLVFAKDFRNLIYSAVNSLRKSV